MSRRRLLVAAIVVLLCAASAGGGYWFAARSATPRAADDGPVALVLVRSHPDRFLPFGPPPSPEDEAAFRRIQPVMLRSPDVLNRALNQPAAHAAMKDVPEPLEWLAARLTAEFHGDGEILRVGLTGLPRREAATVLNAVVGSYVDSANAHVRRALMERAERLEKVQTEIRDQLQAGRRQRASLVEATGQPADREAARVELTALYQERTGLRVGAAAADAAREKAYAAALTANAAAIKTLETGVRQAAQLDAGVDNKPLEDVDAALTAALARLRIERNLEARVSVLQQADPGPRKD
ncbi:MAG TPA: hypothetical protein VD866_12005 [Urbifossiella sp.]|nr:hypothetical protein [Urbifossiella sp.]